MELVDIDKTEGENNENGCLRQRYASAEKFRANLREAVYTTLSERFFNSWEGFRFNLSWVV